MEYVESTESIDKKITELEAQLEDLEQHAPRADLLARLAKAHPYHPARLAKVFFLLLTVIFISLAALALAAPFAGREAAGLLADLELAVPIPMPVLFAICALCMAVAWVTAGQAALSVARDCTLMPWEASQRRKIDSELRRLLGQRTVIARVEGTPMGARPRITTPVPLSAPASPAGGASPIGPPLRGGHAQAGGHSAAKVPLGMGIATPMPSLGRKAIETGQHRIRSGTPAPPRRTTPPAIQRRGATSRSSPHAPATSVSDTLGAAPVAGSGIGSRHNEPAAGLSYGAPGATEPPSNLMHDKQQVSYLEQVQEASRYTIGLDEAQSTPIFAPVASGAFETRNSTRIPKWGPVDERWLEDAIQKSEILAGSYPVQAFISFSPEPELPFVLVLNRATPAMAVRSMVAYVEFLASIATPPRARIELRSVAHIDRSFYRNVLSALEPYFPDTVDLEQRGHRVEITFLEPDIGWSRHPHLPIQG